ncbi:hypothetical protein KKH27_07180 [bacterium]|nr:hypothetical protein [bacterium]MBU1983219.1 hypothetical protein [bacterium]
MFTEFAPSTKQTYSAATLAGALAHELNNPMQGILSLLSVLNRECEDPQACRVRVGQIRSGLARLKRIVESFSVAYENLPREPERITVGDFHERLALAMSERQLRANGTSYRRPEASFYCLWPEVVRLVSDAFSLPTPTDGLIHVENEAEPEWVCIICKRDRDSRTGESEWRSLNERGSFSGLAVLIDEIVRMSQGTVDFQFHDASLDGIRLRFRTDLK